MYARYRCASRRAYFSSLRSARRKNERERDLENYLEQTARLQVILHLGRICRADRRRSCSCQQSWAAIWTGSAAVMSEAIHSIVDTTKRNLICSTESIAPGGKPTEITHLVMEGKCIFGASWCRSESSRSAPVFQSMRASTGFGIRRRSRRQSSAMSCWLWHSS
jgi:hypothetical protein